MYDFLAELFVYGVAVAYLVLFAILAQYWARNLMRSRRKPVGSRPAGSTDSSRGQA